MSEALVRLLPLIAYCICFGIYYTKIKAYRNDISIGMVKVWGTVLLKVVMTAGMLLLGYYLKRGAGENGDQCDTGGISEQA